MAARTLLKTYPWTTWPLIVSAPMRIMAGPELALAVSSSGGLGFIGPGAKPQDIHSILERTRELLTSPALPRLRASDSKTLPIGVGFQIWDGDSKIAAAAVKDHRPCAAWLFAPREGQQEIDEWMQQIRNASPGTQIWIQVGTLAEAIDASKSKAAPDVLVIQGAEAGGHGRASDGLGINVLFPEVADALKGSNITLAAAGGIVDGRGVASVLGLGAAAAVMGTRFLASSEAEISKGYQNEILRASDGAKSTTRTMLYNHLRGTMGWPEQFSPRTLINKSFVDHQAGVPFEELKRLHDEAQKSGDSGWGPDGRLATYVGAGVGLVKNVDGAGNIVREVQEEAKGIFCSLYKASL
ncbi:uncharacterized protein K452DRAFT_238026 [Aplosporella prunicola CBS 121167]|uniref:Uncharacterized protein n=1 Tax=Aplosporella prunicola CBS 121167 TaxID=1176127 RepID=A0A6A6AWQ2_9PEZI|nr:uncharacterized protein K452DRAFT_238026 [Aplosporella prunicola CBS 121167]KAF2136160.1 hypothetical protein K452DRAFT_238026 [Aplosporella prunicola CBS 121167]